MFGALLLIVGTMVGAVLLGMLIDRARRPPPAPPVPREAHYATEPLEVRFGALVTARHRPGDILWVRIREDGSATVFESARGNRIIGFVDASVLAPGDERPAPSSRLPGSLRSLFPD